MAILGTVASTVALVESSDSNTTLKFVLTSILVVLLSYFIILTYLERSSRQYASLRGIWKCYHLTRDSTSSNIEYWAKGEIEIHRVTSGWKVRARHRDFGKANYEYAMEGNLNKGIALFLEKNLNERFRDDCLAYFDNLMRGEHITGFWLGPNYDQETTIGPYILSQTELSSGELHRIAITNPIRVLHSKDGLSIGI
ncbi:MAG: hypothetical protein AAF808_00440 [Cyanobacteria bacterium P01_D01_bin.2]